MALFSDLLPYILQQQQTALPGGPNLGPAIPRSPTNVTAMNMPSAKLPGAFDFANSANNFANTMGENVLRQQQAHLYDLQAQRQKWMLQNLPEALKLQMDAFQSMGGGGGAGGSEQGGSLLQGSGTSGKLSPTGGATPSDGGTYWTPEGLAALRPTEGRYDQIHYPSGNPSTATGAYGFLDSTWQEQAKKAGVDINQYPRAYLAPPAVQDMVAANTPIHHWTGVDANGKPFNAAAQRLATNPKYVFGGTQTAAAMKGDAGPAAGIVPPSSPETITVPPAADSTPPGDDAALRQQYDAGVAASRKREPQTPVESFDAYKARLGDSEDATPGDQGALAPGEAGDQSPGFAGKVLVAQAQSPREQLNEQIRAQLGERQVAGEGVFGPASAGGGFVRPSPWFTGVDASSPPPALPSRAVSMPFNPAAQAVAGPSPAVPSAPAGGPKPAGGAPPPAYAPPRGVTLDPGMVKTLQAALMSQMTGLPGGDLLLKAYEASPAYAEQRAAAAARGGYAGPSADVALQTRLAEARRQAEVDIERRNIIPLAQEKAQAATIPVQTFLAEAAKYPEGDPRRNFYMNQAAVAGGIKEPVVPQTRPNVPGQTFDAPSNSFQPSALALPNMVTAATEAARGSGIGKAQAETTPLVAPTLVPKGAAGPGFTEPLKTDAGTVIPPVSMQPPMQGTAKYQEDRNSEFAKFENEWARAVSPSIKSEQRMMAIADALKSYNSGTWASNLSDLRGKLRVVGIELPDSIAGNPALAQEILKNNFSASIEQMRTTGLSRWTQAELFAAQSNTANPNLWGDANQQIIAQTVGALRWERQMNKDFLQAKSHGWQNPEAFQTYWTDSPQNSLSTFVNKTSNDLGSFAGARDFEVKALPNAQIGHIPNEGNAIVIDNHDGKGFVYKTGPKAGQPLSTGQAPTGR